MQIHAVGNFYVDRQEEYGVATAENEVAAACTTLSPSDVSAGYSVVTHDYVTPLYDIAAAFSAPRRHEVHNVGRISSVL